MDINRMRDEYRRASGLPIDYTPFGMLSVSKHGMIGHTNSYYIVEEVQAVQTWLTNNPAPPDPIKPLDLKRTW